MAVTAKTMKRLSRNCAALARGRRDKRGIAALGGRPLRLTGQLSGPSRVRFDRPDGTIGSRRFHNHGLWITLHAIAQAAYCGWHVNAQFCGCRCGQLCAQRSGLLPATPRRFPASALRQTGQPGGSGRVPQHERPDRLTRILWEQQLRTFVPFSGNVSGGSYGLHRRPSH
jgi:hypothetical protein